MTVNQQPVTRTLALRTVLTSLAAAAVVTLGASLVTFVIFAGLGRRGLDSFFFVFVAFVGSYVLAPLFAPYFVIRRMQKSVADHDLRPATNGAVIGVYFLGLALAVVGIALGDRTGSNLNPLATVCWLLAIVVGLVAMTELLNHLWSRPSTSIKPAGMLTAASVILLLVAALPWLMLKLNSRTNLYGAVIDVESASDRDWQVAKVTDYSPEYVKIELRQGSDEEAAPAAFVFISHRESRCDESYSCEPAGQTREGSEVLSISRDCGGDRPFPRANLLVEQPRGVWTITSDVVTTYCSEEPAAVSLDDLQDVLALLQPSSDEDFAAFISDA